MLLFLFSVAAAADFSGAWAIDEAASQSMDPVLALQDVSWVKRKLAESMDHEQVAVQTDTGLTITYDNLVGPVVQELFFDGQPHASVNPAGLPTTFIAIWQDEALVATGPVTNDDGREGYLKEHRTLSADGETMTILVTVAVEGAGEATVRRVFRRL